MKWQTRYQSIPNKLFTANRARLKELLLPNSIAVVNTNDIFPSNADGSLRLVPNTDLFYLTGIEQEQSILLLYPDAHDEKLRELLFIRDLHPDLETWEGHKLTKEEARAISGVERVHWLSEFPRLLHRLICESEHVYLNTNEHKRAVIEVETREARFVADVMRRYPLHDYQRLARIMHPLRVVKSEGRALECGRAGATAGLATVPVLPPRTVPSDALSLTARCNTLFFDESAPTNDANVKLRRRRCSGTDARLLSNASLWCVIM